MIKIATIEDEENIRQEIVRYIKKGIGSIEGVEVDVYESAERYLLVGGRYDLVISDIELPGISGLELGKRIKENNPDVYLVFLTSHSEFASESYIIEAYQYILKKDIEERLSPLIERVVHEIKKDYEEYRWVGTNQRKIKIYHKDIVCIQKIKGSKYAEYITENGKYMERLSMNQILEQIHSNAFILVDRGHAVNVNHIVRVRGNVIQMDNGEEITVSRVQSSQVKEKITAYWRAWVSILMIIEIALGMSVFTYSLNMFFSLSREKENQKNQERDLVLEISGGEGMNDIEKQAFTLKDYEKVDEITDGQTFLYVVLPQFYSYKNENYEFVMILVDYKKLDLKNGYTYWGNGLQDIMNCEMNPIPQLEKKQMPTKIAELNWKTETDEIKLKKCVVAPITYMEQYKEEISSAAIHVEWKKKYLKNEEKTIQKIETYLYNSHDQSFRYRIYSPEIELRNNTIKVMTSLQAINKVALLFMAVFLTGMIAIYQLRFEHREESYGISLAYGAQYKELYWEIFCEILLLNSIGTIIGIVIGYLVTYYVDFGIMISVVNVQGSWYTFLSAYGLCVVLSSFVSVITFRKLKKKKIIELLNVY